MNEHAGSTRTDMARVVVVDDMDSYLDLALRTDEQLSVVPVLRSGGADAPVVPAPGEAAPHPGSWTGTVFLTDPEYAPVAQVLAGGTGRPLRRGSFAEAVGLSRSEPVTVVGPARELTPARLALSPPDARIGSVVAPDVAAASALVARTLLSGPAVAGFLRDLSFDTLAGDEGGPERLTGPGVTVAALRAALAGGVAILAGRGHARDCAMDLLDGTICGRAEERPLLPVLPAVADRWSEHPTACQQSQMCCKYGLTIDGNLRAADIPATFVVLDSCRTAVSGAGAVRADVSIPLTMLAGSALAVVCAVGTRGGSAWAAPLFRALLRSGMSLGAALAEVNGAIDVDPGGLGRLALFGDAGLVPVPAAAPGRPVPVGDALAISGTAPATLVDGTDLIASSPGGPLVVPRADRRSSWILTAVCGRAAGPVTRSPDQLDVRWQDEFRPWSRNLRKLPGLGWQIDGDGLDESDRRALSAVRRRAEADHLAAARDAVRAFEAARDDLVEIQHQAVQRQLATVARCFYHFVGGWPEPWWNEADPTLYDCPQCGDRTVTRHLVTPSAGTGPRLCYLVCVRCGEVVSGSEDFPVEVELTAPAEVRRGEPFSLEATVTAPAARAIAVTVGASSRRQDLLRCRLAGIESVTLAATERRTFRFTGTSDRVRTIPDLHNVVVLVAAAGAVRCLTRSVWMRA